jgi:hypothetical protein
MSKIKATPELQKEIVRLYRDENWYSNRQTAKDSILYGFADA